MGCVGMHWEWRGYGVCRGFLAWVGGYGMRMRACVRAWEAVRCGNGYYEVFRACSVAQNSCKAKGKGGEKKREVRNKGRGKRKRNNTHITLMPPTNACR